MNYQVPRAFRESKKPKKLRMRAGVGNRVLNNPLLGLQNYVRRAGCQTSMS
jgi:hypothetical protein